MGRLAFLLILKYVSNAMYNLAQSGKKVEIAPDYKKAKHNKWVFSCKKAS